MNNQAVLEKAIKKAMDGGWIAPNPKFNVAEWTEGQNMLDNPTVKYSVWFDTGERGSLFGHIYHITDIIYDHDFAKALWGEPHNIALAGELHELTNKGWRYHLQQMVIVDDPIKYLGDNI